MDDAAVAAQYERGDLLGSILAGLQAAGRDPEHLGPDDLAEVEEFHTLGRPATLALADAAGIGPGDHVLDVGGGLGGPARTLARTTGCRVTTVDLTPEFCAVARELNRRSGLDEAITVVEGNALDLPFGPGSFDVVWTQHMSMNIADKASLYREFRRVARDGGRLAFFDVVAGPNQPIHLPVMWADDAAMSNLATPEEVRTDLHAAGFAPEVWDDVSEQSLAFFAMAAAWTAAGGPPPPLGMHLVIPGMPAKFAAMKRNLEEDRIRLLRGVAAAGT